MCIEDLRLGRKKYTKVSQVTLNQGVSTVLCPFSANRVHICVHQATGSSHVAPSDIDVTANGSFNVISSAPPLNFDIETHGDVVTKQWNGSGVAATTLVVLIETFADVK